VRLTVAAALTCALLGAAALEAQGAIQVSVVSRTSAGVPANGYSTTEGNGGMLSGDGTVAAFESNAANLPAGNGTTFRCYVRRIATGKTILVSVNNNGVAASTQTFSPAVSGDGRYVAFDGTGMGLPGANGSSQVWVRDLQAKTTVLASKANNGTPGNGFYPSVSGDGRFVAFESSAANMPGGDGTHSFVYRRDLKLGKTALVSRDGNGNPATGDVYGQLLSADGRFVVFRSNDADLPSGNGTRYHVYLRDMQAGVTKLVDKNAAGKTANDDSGAPSISADGHTVAFDTQATNFQGGSVEGQSYVRDMTTGKTKLVSQNTAGQPQNQSSLYAHPSGDGRYVAFYADGSNLPGGDGSTDQIYVRDTHQGTTVLVSKAANGQPGNDYSEYPSISEDGRWVEFYGGATNLGGNPSNQNVFRAGPIG
jgi:Tol biopolymer transport system component